MRTVLSIAGLSLILTITPAVLAQEQGPANTSQQQPPPPPAQASRVYYGGTLGFHLFGDVFRLSVQPLIGYKITDKLSVGGKVGYEYIRDKRFDPALTYHNYGASIFTRYRFIPQLYGHVEYAGISFDYTSGREWVPFLLVGGGFAQRIGSNSWAFVEVLFDVLRSSKSPYTAGEPWISIGVGVGF